MYTVSYFFRNPRSLHLYSINYFTISKPTRKHIKEMHTMFNKYSTAFCFIPKPMVNTEVLITGVIFKKTMQKITQYFFLNYFMNHIIQWIVALHQIYYIQQIE